VYLIMGRLPFGYKLFLFLPLPVRRRLKLLSFFSRWKKDDDEGEKT
jgi:hypothetical protein